MLQAYTIFPPFNKDERSCMCMFHRSLFVLLSLFFWPLCCQSFLDLLILITLLVSPSSSYYNVFTKSLILARQKKMLLNVYACMYLHSTSRNTVSDVTSPTPFVAEHVQLLLSDLLNMGTVRTLDFCTDRSEPMCQLKLCSVGLLSRTKQVKLYC